MSAIGVNILKHHWAYESTILTIVKNPGATEVSVSEKK